MQRMKLDPFGEPMELTDGVRARSSASKWLTLAGSSTFWVLVFAIVGARAIYFEPEMLDGFKQVVAFLQGVSDVL